VPKFFFHLYDDLVAHDEEGQQLLDQAAAVDVGVRSARHLACAEVLEGHLNLKHRIEVEDESGNLVTTIRFEDVIAVQS